MPVFDLVTLWEIYHICMCMLFLLFNNVIIIEASF